MFLIELSEEETQFKEPVEFVTRCSKKSSYYSSFENLWFKFPLFFEKSKVNGLEITKRILRFLYNEAYQGKKNGFFSGGKTF